MIIRLRVRLIRGEPERREHQATSIIAKPGTLPLRSSEPVEHSPDLTKSSEESYISKEEYKDSSSIGAPKKWFRTPLHTSTLGLDKEAARSEVEKIERAKEGLLPLPESSKMSESGSDSEKLQSSSAENQKFEDREA